MRLTVLAAAASLACSPVILPAQDLADLPLPSGLYRWG